MRPFFPIIYVRGFAFSDRELEQTSDDPTNGFNVGTTHVRQGRDSDPLVFRFPGPFIRLITDYGYSDVMRGGTDSVGDLKDRRKSLWIHRYYEPYSDSFGAPGLSGRPSVRQAGNELRALIEYVRGACFAPGDPDRRVILIAHSMGGLICRSAIESYASGAADIIEKVVTYGTPHGGVPLARNWIWYHGANSFTEEDIRNEVFSGGRMWATDIQALTHFPPERFLCVIGTNFADYEIKSRWLTGAGSDGLVMAKHAFVRNAPRVYVHRSHSGRYGLVSSPEAFAAVERFLFGNLRAAVRVSAPGTVYVPDALNGSANVERPITGVSLVDYVCTVGPEDTVVNDRRADNFSALQLIHDGEVDEYAAERDLFVFAFVPNDEDEGTEAQVCSISLSIRTEFYSGRHLLYTRMSLRQTLRLLIKKVNGEWGMTYRWLGQEAIESREQEISIAIPDPDLDRVWEEPLLFEVSLTDEDEEGTPGETSGDPESGGTPGTEDFLEFNAFPDSTFDLNKGRPFVEDQEAEDPTDEDHDENTFYMSEGSS